MCKICFFVFGEHDHILHLSMLLANICVNFKGNKITLSQTCFIDRVAHTLLSTDDLHVQEL